MTRALHLPGPDNTEQETRQVSLPSARRLGIDLSHLNTRRLRPATKIAQRDTSRRLGFYRDLLPFESVHVGALIPNDPGDFQKGFEEVDHRLSMHLSEVSRWGGERGDSIQRIICFEYLEECLICEEYGLLRPIFVEHYPDYCRLGIPVYDKITRRGYFEATQLSAKVSDAENRVEHGLFDSSCVHVSAEVGRLFKYEEAFVEDWGTLGYTREIYNG